jgi:Carboxypeptidase regulatory-like domain
MRLHASFALSLWLCALLSSSATAQIGADEREVAREGATSSGLCGLMYTGLPRCTHGLTLSGSAGYGTTQLNGHHDRLTGNLGIAYAPLDWLALSLELAGRLDFHPDGDKGTYVTGTGDPWLRGRVGWDLKPGLALGGELGIWFPGTDAPSFTAAATTLELKPQLSWRTRAERWLVLGMLGVRIDNSANSAPDLTRLRQADRVSLGLSDFHALLVGVGAAHRPLPALQVFAELSVNLLLGEDAPPLLESPMRAVAGARYFVLDELSLELSTATSLSQQPSTAPDAPLVPIEPRFSVFAGVRYRALSKKPVEQAPAPPTQEVVQPTAEPALATLRGVLTDKLGAALPDVAILLNFEGGEQETISDAEGRYTFRDLKPGKVTLSAHAPGFKAGMWEVEVRAPLTNAPAQTLDPADEMGSLRCLVRSFRSEPLQAEVVVRDLRGKRVAGGTTNAQGLLEIPLTAGRYRVMIEVAGYKSQRTNVQVAPNEVAILNVDMREGK